MTSFDSTRTVAELVTAHPECAQVFQDHRIDFCCRGNVSVAEACRARGLDAAAILSQLEATVASRVATEDGPPEFQRMSAEELVAWIVETHHAYLREKLPWLATVAAKVARVHGARDRRLVVLEATLASLSALLVEHLDEEERELFPRLVAGDGTPETRALLVGMREEHAEVGALLERLRDLAGDYVVPSEACGSHRALLAELKNLESDVLRHVHLENHVLARRFA